jgi:ketosteroid isomerase-like protein
MRKLLIAFIVGATMAASTAASASAMPLKAITPVQVVRASFEALNRGDAAGAAAAFAPNGELITPLGGCNPCTGRAVIQQHLSRAVASGTTVTLVGRPQVKRAVVTFRGEVRASSFPAGIQRVIGVFRSTTRKGFIVRQTNDYDRSDPQTAALLTAIQQASGTTTSS